MRGLETDHQFAEIAAGQQSEKGPRRIFQTLHKVFAVLDAALIQPPLHGGLKFGEPRAVVVEDDESAHGDSFDQDRAHQNRGLIRRGRPRLPRRRHEVGDERPRARRRRSRNTRRRRRDRLRPGVPPAAVNDDRCRHRNPAPRAPSGIFRRRRRFPPRGSPATLRSGRRSNRPRPSLPRPPPSRPASVCRYQAVPCRP